MGVYPDIDPYIRIPQCRGRRGPDCQNLTLFVVALVTLVSLFPKTVVILPYQGYFLELALVRCIGTSLKSACDA